jgi:5-methylthioadenosine/S-adenosylhomocysteine deaminase
MKLLVKNCRYLNRDKGEDVFSPGSLAMDKGLFVHVGEVPETFTPDRIIDGKGMLALPGLVNSHTHVSMSLLRNMADDMELMDWLQNRIWPVEGKMGPEDIYIGALLSMIELIHSGVTAFADMYFSMDQVIRAATEAGLRINAGVGLTGTRESSREKLKAFRSFYREYHQGPEGSVMVDLAPHAPYTCDRGCLEAAAETAAELGCGIHIHLSETSGEVKECRKQHGVSPIVLADRAGLFSQRTIAAHCVHVDDEDMELLAQKRVNVVHNPTSNLKLASGFAPLARMAEKGVPLSIGTDGPSSNNNQNMLEEIHIAAILAKAVAGNPVVLPAARILDFATRGGSAALGLAPGAGKLEKGAPADMILIKTGGAHLTPLNNPASALVYGASSSDVDTLVCRGEVLMTNGLIETIDEERVIARASEAAAALLGL